MVYDINKIRLENEIYQIEKMLENHETRSCVTDEDCSNGLKKYLEQLKKQLKEYENEIRYDAYKL